MQNLFSSLTAAVITLIGGLILVLFISFMLSWPVFMLWNGCLVGAVTGVSTVSWLQAWGISVLCSFLFKSSMTKKN